MKRIAWLTLAVILTLWTGSELVAGGPELLLTEFLYDPPGRDAEREWLEIANVGVVDVELSAYKVGDEETPGGTEGMHRFPNDNRFLAAGEVIVVAQTAVGFQALTGANPDYELKDSDPGVPDMLHYPSWGDGEMALANGGDELLLLGPADEVVDAVSYGDRDTFFNPPAGLTFSGQSLERNPAICDSNSAVDWLPLPRPAPGRLTTSGTCRLPDGAEGETLSIGQIQGNEDISPLVNQVVSFRGVVTGIMEDRNTAGQTFYTLFVQDLPEMADGDASTSDGIAVFLGLNPPSLETGDQVRVRGLVTEFFGLTEIDDDGLQLIREAGDLPMPEPITIEPPADNEDQRRYLEPLEGMRVTLAGPAWVTGATFSGCSFAVVGEGAAGQRIVRRRLEDGAGQIVPVLHNSDVDCQGFPDVKYGDRITGLNGPLHYHFDQFKIVQQAPSALRVTSAITPTLPVAPVLGQDEISLATLNVENYFDSIDDTGDDAEPKPSLEDIAIKEAKLSHLIGETLACPTILGIQEVENAALLEALVGTLAQACGFVYQVTHADSPDARGIDVALLSDRRRVAVVASRLQQACSVVETEVGDPSLDCPDGQMPLFSRPPLQVEIEINGRAYTLYVNHFKSKRGGEEATAPQRLAQARHISDLVAARLAADAGAGLVVLGDFNDYELSPTMLTMTAAGQLVNILSRVPETERYSFVFSGASQLIDGILLSPALVPDVVAVDILHVNADYPDILGSDLRPGARAYRATDHDPAILTLRVDSLEQPTTRQPTPEQTPAPSPLPPVTPANSPDEEPAPDAPAPGSAGWLGGALLVISAAGLALLVWRRRRRVK